MQRNINAELVMNIVNGVAHKRVFSRIIPLAVWVALTRVAILAGVTPVMAVQINLCTCAPQKVVYFSASTTMATLADATLDEGLTEDFSPSSGREARQWSNATPTSLKFKFKMTAHHWTGPDCNSM